MHRSRTRQNPGQDERSRRAQRAAAASLGTEQSLQAAVHQAARAGVRTDWISGVLAAWPRLKRGGLVAPDKLTYDQARAVVQDAFMAMGWLPKMAGKGPCLYEDGHKKWDAVLAVGGGQVPGDLVALMHVRPELRGWSRTDACHRCHGTRQEANYQVTIYPPGFPQERDLSWQPIPYGALISPDFEWHASVHVETVGFQRWIPAGPNMPAHYGAGSLMGNEWPLPVPPFDGSQPAAWRYRANNKDVAVYLWRRAMNELGLPNLAVAAAEKRSTRKQPPEGPASGLRRSNPRGDEGLRRLQRDGGDTGRDPKLEAWRRGLAVPPDRVIVHQKDWPAREQALWFKPGADARIDPSDLTQSWIMPGSSRSETPPFVSVMSWLIRDTRRGSEMLRIYEVYYGRGIVRSLTTFDYGNPRWDDQAVQHHVFLAYQEQLPPESYEWGTERSPRRGNPPRSSDQRARRLDRERDYGSEDYWRAVATELRRTGNPCVGAAPGDFSLPGMDLGCASWPLPISHRDLQRLYVGFWLRGICHNMVGEPAWVQAMAEAGRDGLIGMNEAVYDYVSATKAGGVKKLSTAASQRRDMALMLKNDGYDPTVMLAREIAAREILHLIPPEAILVPAPSSSPTESRDTWANYLWCESIAYAAGQSNFRLSVITPVVRHTKVEPSHQRRRKKRAGATVAEHQASMRHANNFDPAILHSAQASTAGIPRPVVIVDNVLVTGNTIEAVRQLIGRPDARGVCYAQEVAGR